jgi:hypothetical protein
VWALFSVLLLLAGPAGRAVEPAEAVFDEGGLAALHVRGAELLRRGRPRLHSVVLERRGADAEGRRTYAFETLAGEPSAVRWNAEARTLIQTYPWGELRCAYAPAPQRLGLEVTLVNRTDRTLADFRLTLLELAFPAAPEGWDRRPPRPQAGLDRLVVQEASWGETRLLAWLATVDPPVRFGFGPAAEGEAGVHPLRLEGGVWSFVPGEYTIHPHGRPRVAPGESLTLRAMLRWGGATLDRQAALAELYDRFRRHHRPRLDWPDRRPVMMLMLSSVAHRSETNPRGWFNDKKLDVTTEEGRQAFRRRARRYAERSVENLLRMNAQGANVWDIEGQEHPHPTSYIGDPRLVGTFAPEMDAVADEFFRTFTEAGLRVGVTLRPSRVYYDEKKEAWAHGTGSDGGPGRGDHFPELRARSGLPWWRFFPVVERLSAKIRYARERWGCTLFYIDTNGIFVPVGEEAEFRWFLLEAWMWRRLMERHPDVLIIPELARDDQTRHAAQWAYTAPYMELDLKGYGTPARLRRRLPQAFSVVNISDGPIERERPRLVAAAGRGDIFMGHGWWWPKQNDHLLAILKETHEEYIEKGEAAARFPLPEAE